MFELLEHPADIGFRTFGSTLAELFQSAAVAMLSIAGDPAAAAPALEYPIEAEGFDLESLLVNWLNEVLYWFDGKRIAFREFRVTHYEPFTIRALGLGEPRHSDRHRAKLIVKAATYHQIKVENTGGRWVCEVYLDI